MLKVCSDSTLGTCPMISTDRQWRGSSAIRTAQVPHKSRYIARQRPGVNRTLHAAYSEELLVHHWDSHGIPSPSPSISVFGQFFRKNLASLQEVI